LPPGLSRSAPPRDRLYRPDDGYFGGFERNRDGLLAGEGRILGGCRGASPAHMQAVWRQIPENLSD
jgi:hypothetical protein